jgi:hypothetical protein
MKKSDCTLVATLVAKPEKRSELLDILLSQVAPSRAEVLTTTSTATRKTRMSLCFTRIGSTARRWIGISRNRICIN